MDLQLTPTEQEELRLYQRNVSDRDSYVKVTTLLLLSKGLTIAQIGEILGIDSSTIYRYIGSYQNDGLSKYLSTNYKGYWGQLSCSQLSQLRTELNTTLYTDSKQVALWIKQRWNITYTPQGIVDLLNRIGFTYKQTTSEPCEVDITKQLAFVEQLQTLVSAISQEESAIYFADAVHPTHNTRSTHAWVEKGTQRVLQTVSGRDRVNINAAYNAIDPVEVIAQEDPTINAQSTKTLFERILQANDDKKVIYVITDNARYYKNKELQEWLKTTKIQLIHLPAYSPNLNPIERLWKFMRQKVINTHFYRTKAEFREALLKFFKNINQYKTELESLLTLKFHIFHSQSFSV